MLGLIRLDNVTAGYDGRPQIRNISLEVAGGSFLGITGPNGGGKTTLLRVLLGLLKPMEGTVAYYRDGRAVANPAIGYLPQHNAMDKDFPISAGEVVLSGLCTKKRLFARFTAAHRNHATEAMRIAGVESLAHRPIKALSGGQLQRVLMARALVSHPEVLVLDEPDTYVDTLFKQQMRDVLDRLRGSCTIIMVSHDTDYLHVAADSVVQIDETLTPLR